MSRMRTTFPKMIARTAAMGLAMGLAMIAASWQPVAAQEADSPTGAEIIGTAIFDGTPPERLPIEMVPTKVSTKDECSSLHDEPVLGQSAIVNDQGKIANVFVYVKKGLDKKAEYAMPSEPAVLNQEGCMYHPRIQGVRVGQNLIIRNTDKLTHNTRSYAFRNRAFNIAQPADSDERIKVFNRPEKAIQMGCDIHGWMKAFIFAMDHPFYAVTDNEGRFRIAGLPAGEYTVTAWHEEFGEQDAKIKIGSSGSTELDFTFKADQE